MQVTDKLKGLGIDLDNNRFLILQVSAVSPAVLTCTCECTDDKCRTSLRMWNQPGTSTYIAQSYNERFKALAKSVQLSTTSIEDKVFDPPKGLSGLADVEISTK